MRRLIIISVLLGFAISTALHAEHIGTLADYQGSDYDDHGGGGSTSTGGSTQGTTQGTTSATLSGNTGTTSGNTIEQQKQDLTDEHLKNLGFDAEKAKKIKDLFAGVKDGDSDFAQDHIRALLAELRTAQDAFEKARKERESLDPEIKRAN